MKLRSTIALLVIALGLGLFIWILDRRSPGRREQRTGYVVDFDRNEVTSLEITNESGKTVLRKTAAGWQIIAPVNDRADPRVVDSLLDQTQFLHRDDTISNLGKGEKKQKRLKDFGLLKSHLKLDWQAKNRHSAIEFGADTAVEGTCYVRAQGNDAVFVTGNELKNLIAKRSDTFRDHQITPFLTAQIDRVIVHQAAGDIELMRQPNGWQIVRPIKARADDKIVNATLEKINATPVLDFTESEKIPGTETENSGRSITLFSGEEKVEISCVSPAPNQPGKIYLRVASRPSLLLVSDSFAQAINVKPNQLRDRRIARLNSDIIDRIRIDQAGTPSLLLARREDHWEIASQQNAPANSEAISRLIATLNGTDVQEFVSDTATDLSRYGLDAPTFRIGFSSYASDNTAESSAGEEPIATLAVGKLEKDAYYARIEEEPYVFSIFGQTVSTLPIHEFDFRSLDALTLQRDELVSVEIETGDGKVELIRDDRGKWLVKEKAEVQDEAALQTFLNTVSQIRAAAWVGPAQPAYGLEHPVETIRIRAKTGQFELQIGGTNERGNRYAVLSNQSGVFLIGANDYQQLSARLAK
jgi:Domain of unknown function (DUF4340)